KNSSRFEAAMAWNFRRSKSGTLSLSASARTRALNSIHESSRLRYSPGERRSGVSPSSGSTTAVRIPSSIDGVAEVGAIDGGTCASGVTGGEDGVGCGDETGATSAAAIPLLEAGPNGEGIPLQSTVNKGSCDCDIAVTDLSRLPELRGARPRRGRGG